MQDQADPAVQVEPVVQAESPAVSPAADPVDQAESPVADQAVPVDLAVQADPVDHQADHPVVHQAVPVDLPAEWAADL